MKKGLIAAHRSAYKKDLLIFPDHKEATTIYENFARSLSDVMEENLHKKHFDAFGAAANIFLRGSLNFIESPDVAFKAEKMAKEIIKKTYVQNYSYEWFIVFIERLSILIAEDQKDQLPVTSTPPFANYSYNLRQPERYISHEKYCHLLKDTGTMHTRKFLSTLSKANRFPMEVQLPFPNELSPLELLKHVPSPYANSLRFIGLPGIITNADGGLIPTDIFFHHEQQHNDAHVAKLTSLAFEIPQELDLIRELFSAEMKDLLWQLLLHQRRIQFFVQKHSIENLHLENDTDSDTKKMAEFFCFYAFHENTAINTPEDGIFKIFDISEDKDLNTLRNPMIYASILPEQFTLLSNDEFTKKFNAYREVMLSEVVKITSDPSFQQAASHRYAALKTILDRGYKPFHRVAGEGCYASYQETCIKDNIYLLESIEAAKAPYIRFTFFDNRFTDTSERSAPEYLAEIILPPNVDPKLKKKILEALKEPNLMK